MKKSIQLLTIFVGVLVLFASCDKQKKKDTKRSSEHFMRQKNQKSSTDKYQRDSHPMRQNNNCDDGSCEKPCKKNNGCRCKSCLNEQQAQDKILDDQSIRETQEEVFANEPIPELNEEQVFEDQNVALEYEEVESSEK